jgi:hypothetical protein
MRAGPIVSEASGFSNLAPSATTLLPEQAKPSRSIKRMVLPIRQFYLGLAHRGSCQAALHRVCKPQVGGSIPLANSTFLNQLARTSNRSETMARNAVGEFHSDLGIAILERGSGTACSSPSEPVAATPKDGTIDCEIGEGDFYWFLFYSEAH